MDATLRLRLRHPLHPVRSALVLEHAVRAVALDLERVRAVAHGQRLYLEAAPLGVAAEHPVEVAGEQSGLFPAGSLAHLHDHVLLVVGIALDHREPDLLVELAQPRFRALEQLAQLRVIAVLGEQLARAGGIVGGLAVFPRELMSGLELPVGAPNLRVALPVPDHLGVRHLVRKLAETSFDLGDERIDHRGS